LRSDARRAPLDRECGRAKLGREVTHTVPDFADAVGRHQVIAAIERSAASGERVKA